MPRYDLDDEYDEIDLRRSRWNDERPHSGLGIMSLTAAALALLLVAGAVAFAIIIDAAQPAQADDDWIMALVGVAVLAAGCCGVAGLCLGLTGSVQADRKPLLAILGTIANGLALLGIVVLMCVGALAA